MGINKFSLCSSCQHLPLGCHLEIDIIRFLIQILHEIIDCTLLHSLPTTEQIHYDVYILHTRVLNLALYLYNDMSNDDKRTINNHITPDTMLKPQYCRHPNLPHTKTKVFARPATTLITWDNMPVASAVSVLCICIVYIYIHCMSVVYDEVIMLLVKFQVFTVSQASLGSHWYLTQ